MAHDVFISYSAKDKAVADAVCATLEGSKIRCWIAPRDVLPGISYAKALIQALNRSRLLVLVFSASSNDSPQVMREVERAVNKGIPIIPFRIENVTPSEAMEYFLSAPHWLDALTPPLKKHLQRLTDTVQVLLAEVEKPTPPSTEIVEPKPSVPQPSSEAKRRKKVRLVRIISGFVVVTLFAVGTFFLVDWFRRYDEAASNVLSTSAATTAANSEETTAATTAATSDETSAETTAATTAATPGETKTTSPLTSGASLRGEITSTGEVHWYTFDAEVGDAVYIVLTEGIKDSPMDPWLGLLDPDGSAVVYEDYGSQSVSIDYKLTKAGKYTIRVRDHANVGGLYTLSFSMLVKT